MNKQEKAKERKAKRYALLKEAKERKRKMKIKTGLKVKKMKEEKLRAKEVEFLLHKENELLGNKANVIAEKDKQ
ncbi:hypothetical protein ACV20C_001544 [Campylobacter upsaliensis]|uniref:hypothetical protein n=1 Tax=Campylobacter upsaliensis TaxID=28080 RepID=UPI0012736300|nr:hypothetical protein [Campylobacter upsaliensis]EAJ7674441.1 hypothetical protein [Campylobacter upsaliensis]EAJ9123030.1 hypothetical protein [Campylobacter upsaliensis]EAK4283547.1 hypothetical protein [Campylobacter upsaliensis]EAK4313839.1 hypothetical protein [Campylobacter upsaliensis]EDP6885052.1 hypothetical protein [Campylobacter upsaliensis]